MNHRDRSTDEVAEIVGEIRVEPREHRLVREARVLTERHLAHHEVAEAVQPEDLGVILVARNVAERLRHLRAAHQPEAVRDDPTRHRQASGHQKRRPVERVLAHDLLADEVRHRWPQASETVLGRRITRSEAERREVVRQRVEPHVHHVLRVVRHRNAPLERRPADAEILQPGLDERTHLVQPELRLDEVRMIAVVVEQRLLVLRQAEVVALLLQALDLAAARRTLAVNELRFRDEDLVDRAVPALRTRPCRCRRRAARVARSPAPPRNAAARWCE